MDFDQINEILFDSQIGFWYYDLMKDTIQIQIPDTNDPHKSCDLEFSLEKVLNMVHPEDKIEFQRDLIAIQQKQRTIIDQKYRIKKLNQEYALFHVQGQFTQVDGRQSPNKIKGLIKKLPNSHLNPLELKNEPDLWNKILETIPIGVVLLDIRGIIVYISPKIEQILGYSYTEVVGRSVNDIQWGTTTISGKSVSESEIAYQQVIKTRSSVRNVTRIMKRKDGSLLYIQSNGEPVKNKNGEIIGAVFSFEDITENQRNQALSIRFRDMILELSKSDSLHKAYLSTLQALLDISGMDLAGFYLKDPLTDEFNLVNYLNIDSELLEKIKIIPKNDLRWKVMIQKQPKFIMKNISSYPGGNILIQFNIKSLIVLPILYEDTIIGCINLGCSHEFEIHDYPKLIFESVTTQIGQIINRFQIQDSLRSSEQRYRRLFSEMKLGFAYLENVFGKNGYPVDARIVEINPAMENIIRLKRSDILNKTIFEVSQAFNRDWFKRLSEVGALNKNLDVEIYSDSLKKSLEVISYSPIKNEYVILIQDVSEKRKLYLELQKVQKIESLGVLAGGIAHDFNNILMGILGNLSLAAIIPDQSHELQEILDDATTATARAKDLIQQLLTFAKGGEPIKKVTTIQNLLFDSTEFILRGSKIKPIFQLQENLWPVEIDESQISRVIQNIVINAKDAMPDGGKIIVGVENVDVTKEFQLPIEFGHYLRVKIQDIGLGISKENMARLFEPYFTTKFKGNGLGLAVSFSIIKRHNGYITVESEVGIGSTFLIYLPASQKNIMPQENPSQNLIKGHGNLLIMDDDQDVRHLLAKMLQKLGFNVVETENGQETLKIYSENMKKDSKDRFRFVILDLTVPGAMGGRDTMAKLLKMDPKVKGIISSGYSDDPIIAHYKDHGFYGRISKPYTIQDISIKIQELNLI